MEKRRRILLTWTGCLILLLAAAGCTTTYYAAMEKLGKEKRHLLTDNVKDVKDSQEEAKEEFTDALTQIQALYGFDGGELEDVYKKIKSSYEDCRTRAEQIETRIAKVKTVAKDLFAEWDTEISAIQDPDLQAASRRSKADTQARFRKLEAAMDQSARAMSPVLAKLNDMVLFLKHNLNARAIGALGKETLSIETDVDALIKEMNRAIAEADQFIAHM
jgi:predicted  nucleic acid-binding Zn-ribbon protein